MHKSELRNWSVKKLKDTVKELHCSIYNMECYSVNDLVLYDWIIDELDRRNVLFSVNEELVFDN